MILCVSMLFIYFINAFCFVCSCFAFVVHLFLKNSSDSIYTCTTENGLFLFIQEYPGILSRLAYKSRRNYKSWQCIVLPGKIPPSMYVELYASRNGSFFLNIHIYIYSLDQ